jgi:hypothetical protein
MKLKKEFKLKKEVETYSEPRFSKDVYSQEIKLKDYSSIYISSKSSTDKYIGEMIGSTRVSFKNKTGKISFSCFGNDIPYRLLVHKVDYLNEDPNDSGEENISGECFDRYYIGHGILEYLIKCHNLTNKPVPESILKMSENIRNNEISDFGEINIFKPKFRTLDINPISTSSTLYGDGKQHAEYLEDLHRILSPANFYNGKKSFPPDIRNYTSEIEKVLKSGFKLL